MSKKVRRVFIVIVSLLILLCLFNIGLQHIEYAKHQRELSEIPSYEVYSSYVANENKYYIYVMCNPEYDLSDILVQKFTSDYFLSLKSKIDSLGKKELQTILFMMLPSGELPYGWEKDELNISCNFDQSAFHRATTCTVTVPYGAKSLDGCILETINQKFKFTE